MGEEIEAMGLCAVRSKTAHPSLTRGFRANVQFRPVKPLVILVTSRKRDQGEKTGVSITD